MVLPIVAGAAIEGKEGRLDWFESLPEGLQTGILAFMDTQVLIMAACQVPGYWAKHKEPAGDAAPKGSPDSSTGSTHRAAAG